MAAWLRRHCSREQTRGRADPGRRSGATGRGGRHGRHRRAGRSAPGAGDCRCGWTRHHAHGPPGQWKVDARRAPAHDPASVVGHRAGRGGRDSLDCRWPGRPWPDLGRGETIRRPAPFGDPSRACWWRAKPAARRDQPGPPRCAVLGRGRGDPLGGAGLLADPDGVPPGGDRACPPQRVLPCGIPAGDGGEPVPLRR